MFNESGKKGVNLSAGHGLIQLIIMFEILNDMLTGKVITQSAVHLKMKKPLHILSTKDDHFKMMIHDNGVGMDAKKKTAGVGLLNMNGRLSIFNGTMLIDSAPGKGFRLEVKIPV